MDKSLRSLDLFAGIGGFALGFQRAGIETAAFCEIDPYARKVLAKNFPGIPLYDDVRTLNAQRLADDHIGPIDIIAGGFPCQDISFAGKGAGLDGERSGLWFEYRRVIEEVAPRWVVIENVPALRSRGLEIVLGGLSALGYDVEWHCIPAAAVGAPHRRDRIWLVANAQGEGRREILRGAHDDEGADGEQHLLVAGGHGAIRDVADTHGDHGERRPSTLQVGRGGCPEETPVVSLLGRVEWPPEPGVGRVAHGVPSRVDRLRCLGNAVVPVIPEIIGRAIIHHNAD